MKTMAILFGDHLSIMNILLGPESVHYRGFTIQ